MVDRITHAIIPGAPVRLLAGVTTDLVAEACRRHGTFPAASAALGRTLTGTLLLAMMQKDLERLTVQFNCSGPIGGIIATADAQGRARGYVKNPHAGDDATLLRDGKIDVAAVVGGGTMIVQRELGEEIGLAKRPYIGQVEIVSGEIAEDFAYYLTKSEQIPSGVSLGVFVQNTDAALAEIVAAGGFIVQLMPGADEGLADRFTEVLAAAPHATDLVRAGMGPLEMLRAALQRDDVEELYSREVRFECVCSREQVLGVLAGLDRGTLDEMIGDARGEEVVCPVCNEKYWVDVDTIRELATR